jgi:hypothetical protein
MTRTNDHKVTHCTILRKRVDQLVDRIVHTPVETTASRAASEPFQKGRRLDYVRSRLN